MKNFYSFIIVLISFLSFQTLLNAQGSNCASADPFCTGTTYTFPNTTNNGDLGAIDCLGSSPNPAWYYMEIDQNGNMSIQIDQTTASGSGIDVDFALFGPYSSLANACATIPGGNVVDCSYSIAASETAVIPNAQVGEVYVLLLTNFANQAGNITFNQSGGTGSADCSLLCGVTGFTAIPTACAPATNTYSVSGTLSITNGPTTGTCTITSSCGGTQVFNMPQTSMNYNFTGITANGAGCTVTATFSANASCNTTVTYTAPAACNVTPCLINNFTANISACDPATTTYTINGQVTFSNAPATGTMTVTTCGGNSVVFNAPFTSPINYNITGIPADGTTNCNVTASFSADGACTSTVGPYTEPICPCNMDNMFVNINSCDPATGTYTVTVDLDFTSPPSTGSLQVNVCGTIQNLPMPATSPQTFTITGLNPNGGACTVDAFFTADPSCGNSLNYTAPNGCDCTVDIGTFSDNIVGSAQTDFLLCWNDVLDITSNNDNTDPDLSLNNPGINYDPGMWLLLYSCPPTVFAPDDLLDATGNWVDPCCLGIYDVNDGNWSILNNIGDGTTYYFVPLTMYSMSDGYYSATDYVGACFELGPPYEVTFLPEVTATGVEDCASGTVTVTVEGGVPAVNGGNFTASNLLPATATFNNTTCTDGGTIVISGLQNGDNYSFDVEDANGCPVTFSGGPFVGPVATAINPAGPFCLTDPSVNLTELPATAGTWSGTGITNAATGTFDPATAGLGTWTITFTPSGCFIPSTVNLTVNDVFDATISPAGPFCESNANTFLAAADPGGVWSGPGIVDPATGEFSPTTAGAGTHNITYTIAGGCGDTDNINIQVIADADATITPAGPFCVTDPALNLTAVDPGGTWSGQGITSAANGTFNPATAGAGTWPITYNISGVCGDNDVINITVIDLFPSTITPVGPFCEDDASVNLVGATSGGTWSGTGITDPVNGTFNPSVAGPGTHTITYTISGSCGTSSTLDIVVNPLPVPVFVADVVSGCAPLTVTFTDNTVPAGAICLWSISNGVNSNSCGTFTYTFDTPGTYSVTLTLTSAAGCVGTTTVTNMITVFSNPVADFIFGPNDASVLNSVVNFTNQSTGATIYNWDFAGLGSSSQTNPSYTFPSDAPGTYTVCLEASTVNGCIDSICKSIIINDLFVIYVPNAFTPDGDGINDVFLPILSGIDPLTYDLMIFNRWGELIFETQNYGQSWDGYHKGLLSQEDVYVWKIKVKDAINGEKHEYIGHVTLLK